jgi:hypothetical protein
MCLKLRGKFDISGLSVVPLAGLGRAWAEWAENCAESRLDAQLSCPSAGALLALALIRIVQARPAKDRGGGARHPEKSRAPKNRPTSPLSRLSEKVLSG